MRNGDGFDELIKNFKLGQLAGEDFSDKPKEEPVREQPVRDEPPRAEKKDDFRMAPQYNPARKAPSQSESMRDYFPAPPAKSRPGSRFRLNITDAEFLRIPDAPAPAPLAVKRQQLTQAAQRRRKKSSSGTGGRIFTGFTYIVATLGLAVFLSFFVLASASDLFGLNQPDKEIKVVIEDASSTAKIAKQLKSSGVITQPLTFRIYSSLKDNAGKYKAGEYNFNSKMSYDEIFIALKSGDRTNETVRLTFREGLSLAEIGKMLEDARVCTLDAFMEACNTETFQFEFEEMIPESELRFNRLEGYLFPNTHDFLIGENPRSVIRKFLVDFNKKITSDLYLRMEEMKMSLDEVIILASMIQKEAGSIDEMYTVSSVFHNRLAKPQTYPLLQSDVTIFYVEDRIKPYLATPNQKMYDEYNTYVSAGLPIGPICSPGLDAIKAALYPSETSYTYFVTDKNGKYYYASNLKQHETNVANAMKIDKEVHGIATQ